MHMRGHEIVRATHAWPFLRSTLYLCWVYPEISSEAAFAAAPFPSLLFLTAHRTRPASGSALRPPLPEIRECYKGFSVTLYRNVLLLGTMFSVLDLSTRAAPEIVGEPLLGAYTLVAAAHPLVVVPFSKDIPVSA